MTKKNLEQAQNQAQIAQIAHTHQNTNKQNQCTKSIQTVELIVWYLLSIQIIVNFSCYVCKRILYTNTKQNVSNVNHLLFHKMNKIEEYAVPEKTKSVDFCENVRYFP